MRIISLEAENLKRLKAIEIRPSGALVQITGKNASGKTSTLDAIWYALGGTRNLPTQPIRRGEESARIRVDLGELVVTRTFRAKDEGGFTTSLKVEAADGSSFKSPQAVLDSLVGEFSFDPLEFTRKDAKAQVAALRAFVPDVDFDKIERENATDYEARREVNRRASDLRARSEAIRLPGGAIPKVVDLVGLEDELERAGQHNAVSERDQSERRSAADRLVQVRNEIERLENEAKLIIAKLEVPAAPDPIDTAAVRERIAAARAGNETARQAQQRAELAQQAKKAEDESEALTKAMKARTDAAAKAVAKAKMPVAGLGFGEGHVTLNGVPFDQGSDAEQLRAAIAIAAALQPKLKVIRVRDGSLIDDDGMLALAKYAEENDCQIWCERVDSSGAVGFVIEDGHLKGQDAEPEEVEEAV